MRAEDCFSSRMVRFGSRARCLTRPFLGRWSSNIILSETTGRPCGFRSTRASRHCPGACGLDGWVSISCCRRRSLSPRLLSSVRIKLALEESPCGNLIESHHVKFDSAISCLIQASICMRCIGNMAFGFGCSCHMRTKSQAWPRSTLWICSELGIGCAQRTVQCATTSRAGCCFVEVRSPDQSPADIPTSKSPCRGRR